MMVLKIYLKNGNMLTYTNDESNWDLTQDNIIEIKSKKDNYFVYIPWNSILYVEEYSHNFKVIRLDTDEEFIQDDEKWMETYDYTPVG
ncbi:MAG: hypothetical protein QXX41_07935 [Nitrososphaerota archaeon]